MPARPRDLQLLHSTIEHDPGTLNISHANAITIEIIDYCDDFDEILTSQQLWDYAASVRTLYKRKEKKVLPVNVPLPDGIKPGGGINGGIGNGEELESSVWWGGKFVLRGSRLTPEQLAGMNIGTEFLSDMEKQLFVDIFSNTRAQSHSTTPKWVR